MEITGFLPFLCTIYNQYLKKIYIYSKRSKSTIYNKNSLKSTIFKCIRFGIFKLYLHYSRLLRNTWFEQHLDLLLLLLSTLKNFIQHQMEKLCQERIPNIYLLGMLYVKKICNFLIPMLLWNYFDHLSKRFKISSWYCFVF